MRPTLLTHKGVTRSLRAWSLSLGLDYCTVRERLAKGMTVEQALSPVDFRSSSGELRQRVGDRIRAARRGLGISRESLGRDLGMSGRQIGRLETGDGTVTIVALQRLCQELGLSADELLELNARAAE